MARAIALGGVILAALCGRAVAGGLAVLRIDESAGGSKHHRALFAEWSKPEAEVTAATVAFSQDNPHGCSPLKSCRGCAGLVLQGECTFALKAKHAQAAGMKMLIVASSKESPSSMSVAEGERTPIITALMVSKTAGRQMMLQQDRDPALVATCWQYEKAYADLMGEFVIGFLAVALVVWGAWHSTEDLHRPWNRTIADDEVAVVEESSGPHFVLFGSLMLTVLFFFMKYLIYVLLFMFATGAISTTTMLLEPVIADLLPGSRQKKAYRLPRWMSQIFGTLEDHSVADAVAECSGIILAVCFLLFRNNEAFGWILQDAIAIMLLLTIQRTLRLPNLKVGTLLLVCTFFFDIFWVFISPAIFKKSVMIEVATGGGTGQSVPMVLKIPSLASYLPGQFKILGLGDVAIPGLLISLLLRHDFLTLKETKMRWLSGYFVPGVIGYALGLLATFISLYLMKHGQPALLFLVPGTLLPTFWIAHRKGEFWSFWSASYGPAEPAAPEGYEALPDKQA